MTDRKPAGGGLTRIVLVPTAEVAASHDTPGQYVEVRADGQTGYFVLSSDPGASPWELVMRDGGGASNVLLVMPVPSAVEVTVAIGSGFPMRDARGRELLVALGGTGIAAGPPVVRRRIGDGDARLTRVWIGARGDALPLAEEIEAWRGPASWSPRWPLASSTKRCVRTFPPHRKRPSLPSGRTPWSPRCARWRRGACTRITS